MFKIPLSSLTGESQESAVCFPALLSPSPASMGQGKRRLQSGNERNVVPRAVQFFPLDFSFLILVEQRRFHVQ